MQFQVPQFIDIEDRIFGRLTLKQFIYLAGGVGACVVLWLYIPYKIISVILIIPVAAFALALAFYKVNGKSFIDTVESAFYYYIGDKLYIWKKEQKKPESKLAGQVKQAQSMITVPKMSQSKLRDLTWSLDIKETINPVTHDKK